MTARRSLRVAALALAGVAMLGLGGCERVRSLFAARGGDRVDPPASETSDPPLRTAAVAPAADGGGAGDATPSRGEREVEFPVVPESVTEDMFPDAGRAAFAAARVPVLAPAGMSRPQAQRFVDTFRATPDGYFARINLEAFDVVVNGTRAYAVAPESAGAPSRDVAELHVSESETGMAATFSRYGADYSIEFECRGAGDEGGAACLNEAQARAFVQRLIPVGGGGQ